MKPKQTKKAKQATVWKLVKHDWESEYRLVRKSTGRTLAICALEDDGIYLLRALHSHEKLVAFQDAILEADDKAEDDEELAARVAAIVNARKAALKAAGEEV